MEDENKYHVNIPPGTDLNNGLPPEPEQPHIPDFAPLHEDVIDDLPHLLQRMTEYFKNPAEQELLLVGALTVLSGMMPNVQGKYAGFALMPNLYTFVIGRYGTGKGALVWAYKLGESTDLYRIAQADKAKQAHSADMVAYNRALKEYQEYKEGEQPQMPVEPQHTRLFLPANSSKTGLIQLMAENRGRGIIFETEGDTMADMLRQDYGNFSDILRKAFHHEPVSFFRRKENEDVRVVNPALTVLLSGTQDQLRKLIPSIENGLFSRFCFYSLQGTSDFRDPFDSDLDDLQVSFNVLSDRFLEMYKMLEALEQPVIFDLSAGQKLEFRQWFAQQKKEISTHISEDLEGTVNRLAVICFRIAMILTVVRQCNHLHSGQQLTCMDADFQNAIAITRHIMQYSLSVYEGLASKKVVTNTSKIADKKQNIEEACRCFQMGMSYAQISTQLFGVVTKASTVWGWIKEYCNKAA